MNKPPPPTTMFYRATTKISHYGTGAKGLLAHQRCSVQSKHLAAEGGGGLGDETTLNKVIIREGSHVARIHGIVRHLDHFYPTLHPDCEVLPRYLPQHNSVCNSSAPGSEATGTETTAAQTSSTSSNARTRRLAPSRDGI